MNLRSCLALSGWLFAASFTSPAQTNNPAPEPPIAQPGAATAEKPAAQPTPAAPATETVAAEPAASAPAATESSPAPTPTPGAVIPLIVMDDVPLTDAIKNLARQASINYMLDPRIPYGQLGPDGKVTAQPNVSLRWENISAEQALTALLNNYSLQIVEDPRSKIARVTVKDPAAPPPLETKIIRLNYASPSNVLATVQNTLTDKRSKVTADVRTSQLVVLATENEIAAIDRLVERLDTITKQVLIEARLMETSMNPSSVKGINWAGTLKNQNVAMGNNLKANSPATSLNNTLATSGPKLLLDTAKGFNPATAFLDADGLNATISFLNENAEAKVLATPRAVTLDNETAHISVTRASPIFKNTAGTQGSPGGSEVTYTNLGVILDVTPRISANNYVNLKVVPEVSRVFDKVTKVVADTVNEADRYDIRKIETHVMIPSGNTLVLGGLVQDDQQFLNSKVPLLGDIPGLGRAFRHDSKSRSKSNLIIFITPTIITESDFQPTKTDFMKSSLPVADSDPDWSAWDSGKPKDWKKKSVAPENDPRFAPVN